MNNVRRSVLADVVQFPGRVEYGPGASTSTADHLIDADITQHYGSNQFRAGIPQGILQSSHALRQLQAMVEGVGIQGIDAYDGGDTTVCGEVQG